MSTKTFKFLIFTFFIAVAGLAALFLIIILQLPNIETLNAYVPAESTFLYSADGKIIARFHKEEDRQVVPLSKISPYFQKAVIAVEDPHFYKHHGLDFKAILRATIKNLIYGRIVEGGSTLTQQLSRSVYLTRKKTVGRKLAEAILALQIERRYTKDEILELHLNQVYLGHNAYGIGSAAHIYFGKPPSDLTLAESAMLAGLIRGPEIFSPYKNFQEAKRRQLFVINKLLELNLISENEARLAAAETLTLTSKNVKSYGAVAPYFASYIYAQLIEKFGEEVVYHGGLRVYTTLDTSMQAAAEEVIRRYLTEEGPKYKFSQAALVSLDPHTGYIKALVGGGNFLESQFNRATQAQRQPGSAFKPFVYTAAIEQGLSPGLILQDTATTFQVYPNEWNPQGTWEPKNFDKKFRGPVTMRQALEKSLNVPSVKLLEHVGIPAAISTAQKMGITSHLEPGLALTLGVSEISLLEITSAYGTLANSGVRVEPTAILKIESRDGGTLYKHHLEEKTVLDPNVCAVMVDIMKGVLTNGTGVRGRINRPAAAKTGTTEEYKDAWFIGFVPQLVTGVWVGNDDNSPMQGVAEVAVTPRIWKDYNEKVLADQPVFDFPKPEGLTWIEICVDSGKLPNPWCPAEKIKWVSLWKKDVPKEICDLHGPEEFFNGNKSEGTNEGY